VKLGLDGSRCNFQIDVLKGNSPTDYVRGHETGIISGLLATFRVQGRYSNPDPYSTSDTDRYFILFQRYDGSANRLTIDVFDRDTGVAEKRNSQHPLPASR